MAIWKALFGPGTWGAGGNLVAWVLCGALAAAWLRAKLRAQSALARLHHQQKMDQAQANHDALIAHVTATATLAVTAAEQPPPAAQRLPVKLPHDPDGKPER
jgi:hypothetical protein